MKSTLVGNFLISFLIIPALAAGATLGYASVLDVRERRVPFRTWYPMLVIGVPFTALFYGLLVFQEDPGIAFSFLALTLIFSFIFYLFARFGLFGGADAWALIFIAILIPAFPFIPLLGLPPLAFFPFSVLINAVVLNLFVPLGIFAFNVKNGSSAPFPYTFLGFPVEGERIGESHGFVMEEITEDESGLHRRFIGIGESLRGMASGEGRIYTLDIRRNPEKYSRELELFRRAGKVWISYGVPFIVPITAGFFCALLVGDIIFYLLSVLIGG
jgi:preflagellin peptidase FlaK